jgi:hypothetical protein
MTDTKRVQYTSSNENDTSARLLPVLNRLRKELGLPDVLVGEMTLTEIAHAYVDARDEVLLNRLGAFKND